MARTADELADYLTTQGVTTSDLIFIDWMPAQPDQCLVLYADPGSGSELGFGVAAGVKYENPAVQVVARSASSDKDAAETLAWAAYDVLAAVQAQAIGGTEYLMIRPLQSPSGNTLGPDQNQRPRYSFNVTVRKELS